MGARVYRDILSVDIKIVARTQPWDVAINYGEYDWRNIRNPLIQAEEENLGKYTILDDIQNATATKNNL